MIDTEKHSFHVGKKLSLVVESVSYNDNIHKWYHRFVSPYEFSISGFHHSRLQIGQSISCRVLTFESKLRMCTVCIASDKKIAKPTSQHDPDKVCKRLEKRQKRRDAKERFISFVKNLTNNFIANDSGNFLKMKVIKSIPENFTNVRYCSLQNSLGTVFYATTTLTLGNGRTVITTNPQTALFEGKIYNIVSIIEVYNKKKTTQNKNSAIVNQENIPESIPSTDKSTVQHQTIRFKRGKFTRLRGQCFDPYRQEWLDKLRNCRVLKYPSSEVCRKCQKIFAENEGYRVAEKEIYICEVCYSSLFPSSIPSRYKNPYMRLISTPMGGQNKKK